MSGLAIFATNTGRCINCHGGAELTNASVRHVSGKRIFRRSGEALPGVPTTNVFDSGFNPIGVRPVQEDLGLGRTDPWGVPLSEARLMAMGLFFDPNLNPPYLPSRDIVAVDGAFKTPGLRNIELTAPYFHSGKVWNLQQAVAVMGSAQLGATLNNEETESIVAFLRTLTGEQPKVEYPTLPPHTPSTPLPDTKTTAPAKH